MAKRYWLMKSEPDVFGIDDLQRVGRESWDGVRNFQARNFMAKEMRVGDDILFYHSNAKPPGVAGTARVASEPYPDPTQFDTNSQYHDPKSKPEKPRWKLVDVEFVSKFKRLVPLDELKETAGLEEMLVIRRGMRLSIQPVTREQFAIIKKLGSKQRADR